MDQIAMMGLKVLAEYKKALDQAKEQVEVARTLSRRIEIFEVTITMIPSRGDKNQVKMMTEAVPGTDYLDKVTSTKVSPETNSSELLRNETNEATDYAVSKVKDSAVNAVMNAVESSPLGKF
jgi:preprotein translocase subunit SecD